MNGTACRWSRSSWGWRLSAGAEAFELKLQQLLQRIQSPTIVGRTSIAARPERRSA